MADTYINATAGDGTLKIATVDDGTGNHQKSVMELDNAGVPTKISIGQQLKVASMPIVIASDQDVLSVDLNSQIPSGTNSIGKVGIDSGESIRILREYSNNVAAVPSASRASGNSASLSVALYTSIKIGRAHV